MTTRPGKSTAFAALGGLLVLGSLLAPRPAAGGQEAVRESRPEPHIYYERYTFDPGSEEVDAAFELAREYCARLRTVSSDHVPLLYSSPIGGPTELHVLAASPTPLAMRDAYRATINDEPSMESWTRLAAMASSYDDSVWVPIPLEARPDTLRGRTVVLRTFRAEGHERYSARAAAVALGNYVNRTVDSVDARLYEQSIGELGTYHWLFHVNDYQAWLAAEREMAADERYRELFSALYSRCREGTRTRVLFPQS